jgi:hypothetical protein
MLVTQASHLWPGICGPYSLAAFLPWLLWRGPVCSSFFLLTPATVPFSFVLFSVCFLEKPFFFSMSLIILWYASHSYSWHLTNDHSQCIIVSVSLPFPYVQDAVACAPAMPVLQRKYWTFIFYPLFIISSLSKISYWLNHFFVSQKLL